MNVPRTQVTHRSSPVVKKGTPTSFILANAVKGKEANTRCRKYENQERKRKRKI